MSETAIHPSGFPVYRASALPRILRCPASAVQPGRPALRADFDGRGSFPSRLGRAVHDALSACVREDLTAPPDLGPLAERYNLGDEEELRHLVWAGLRFWRRALPELAEWAVEVKVAAEVDDNLVQGHADVLGTQADGSRFVLDWKSGWLERNHEDQVLAYAWLSTRGTKHEAATVAIAWLRSREVTVRRVSRGEIEAWGERLAEAIRERSVYVPSELCAHCPRRADCPARREFVAASLLDLAPLRDGGDLVPAALAAIYPKVKVLERALENYHDALRVALQDSPLPLGDGMELALTDQARQTIDYAAATAAGIEIPEGALRVAKGEAVKAIREAAPRGLKKAAQEKWLARLQEHGAIAETATQRITVRKERSDAE